MSKTQVPLSQVRDNPHQPRMDVGDVESLAESILKHGVRQLPEGRLVVDGEQPTYSEYTTADGGTWYLVEDEIAICELASGHRRTEAVQLLNDDDTVTDADLKGAGLVPGYVPVDMQRLSDEEMLDLGTIENVQREGLSAIEEARQIQGHVDFGRSNSEIGDLFGGRSASWVSNRKRLLRLPTYVQEHVHDGDLSVREGQSLVPAFQLQNEHPDLVEKIGVDAKPDSITKDALRDDIDSEGIRSRVQDLEDAIELAQRAEKNFDTDSTDTDGPGPTENDHEENASGDDRDDASTPPEGGSGASRDDTEVERAAGPDQGHEGRPRDPEGVSADVTRIALVACSKSKLSTPAQAQGLYQGQLFRKSKAYAQQLVEQSEADRWMILSAKHGLLGPRDMIEPYDETLADADAEEKVMWASDVFGALRNSVNDLSDARLTVLGGKDYYAPLRKCLKAKHGLGVTIETPLEGMDGNGEMMQWLDEQLDEDVYTEPTAREMREPSGDGAPAEASNSDGVPENWPTIRGTAIDVLSEELKSNALARDFANRVTNDYATAPKTIAVNFVDHVLSEEADQSDKNRFDYFQDWFAQFELAYLLPDAEWKVDDNPIGPVDPDTVDQLLSADGIDMWDETVAADASIPSLLVAHRVAGARQETWRTRLIAEAVQEREGTVTEEDIPDETMADVEAEVERRLETQAA